MQEEQISENKAEDGQFEVSLSAFSGPLDLLCHLVERRELDPIKLNLTELVNQYVNFLLESKRTTLNEMAEFFSFASRLLLRKVGSLFPSMQGEDDEEVSDDDSEVASEEELLRMIEIFRPYRRASALLSKLQLERERSFTRVTDDDAVPFYDIGDLYGLSSLWWELLARYEDKMEIERSDDNYLYDEIPDAIPDERQVEDRIEELRLMLKGAGRVALGDLLTERSRKGLIVTLLALLEMSRLGMLKLEQSEILGDVAVVAA